MYFFRDANSLIETNSLLGEDYSMSSSAQEPIDSTNQTLLDLTWPTNTSDFLSGDFMPSKLIQDGAINFDIGGFPLDGKTNPGEEPSKPKSKGDTNKTTQMSWLSLFAELDPLANQDNVMDGMGDRA